LIVGGPTLLRWLFWAFIALYAVGLIVEVAHFVIGHAPVLLYATMAFRLFVGAR